MTRTLFLMRHSKAVDHHPDGDKARPLAPRGRREAAEAGQMLQGRGIQLALCSTAARTRETLECLGLTDPDGGPLPTQYMDALYNCGTETMLQRIGEIEDEVTGLIVVAHSPAIPALAARLAWASSREDADEIRCWFPTSAFSEFTTELSWAELAANDGDGAQLARVERLKR